MNIKKSSSVTNSKKNNFSIVVKLRFLKYRYLRSCRIILGSEGSMRNAYRPLWNFELWFVSFKKNRSSIELGPVLVESDWLDVKVKKKCYSFRIFGHVTRRWKWSDWIFNPLHFHFLFCIGPCTLPHRKTDAGIQFLCTMLF